MAAGRDVRDPDRRQFLAHVGGAAATVAGVTSLAPDALAHEGEDRRDRESRVGERRANEAFQVRLRAARFQRNLGENIRHPTNGDERRYKALFGSFSKTLPHNANGEVDRAAFAALVQAMDSADPDDFERIPLGGTAKLANPQAGFAFGFVGADPFATTLPAAPAFASAETAAEMVELYWAALARDVPFDTFGSDPTIAAAAAELSTLSNFRGPKAGGAVTPGTIFRGPTAGDLVGPYISQLLWKPINYGPYVVDQRVRIAAPNVDFLTDYNHWLTVQNGGAPPLPQQVEPTRRYIITGRDLTEWLHRDFSHQGGTNAVFILLNSGVGLAPGNPYLTSATQSGQFTLGMTQILDLVATVANLSLQACWYQKWSVHRRVRPEEFGGSVHNKLTLGLPRPIHSQLLNSKALAAVQSRFGTALLPMPYAEGCPLHPAYPAGHATFAGAWATILKAFFNTNAVMTGTVVPDPTGSTLVPYTATPLTAGNEIDKLASNVAVGRVTCGVHWRSDSIQGMNLGELCAIRVLQDMRRTWNESFVGFSFKKFDGTTVTI